jgi:hypothetical protein
VVDHVTVLAVHRDEVARTHELMEGAQLALAGVARSVDRLVARVDDLGARSVQVVDDAPDRPLVARNRMRAQYDGVVGAHLEVARVAARQLRQRGQRLALAAGADHADLARGEAVDVLDVDEVGRLDVQQMELARQLDVGLHGAAHEGDLAVLLERHVDDLLDAVDVAGEAGHDHASLGPLEEEPAQRAAHRALRGGEAGLLGVGRVAQQQRHTLVADGGQARDVRAAPVDGREVELEVARVQDDPHLRVEGQRVREGHRVGHGNELHLEGPDPAALAVGDLDEGQVVGDLGLGKAVAGEAQGQRRAVDRDVDVLDEVAQRTGMVLVAVGEHDRVHAIASFDQPAEVGKDQIHAVHRGLGEHEAGVDDDDASVLLDRGAVSADLAQTAEERDANGVLSHAHRAVVR